jgi:hypothetical protein
MDTAVIASACDSMSGHMLWSSTHCHWSASQVPGCDSVVLLLLLLRMMMLLLQDCGPPWL